MESLNTIKRQKKGGSSLLQKEHASSPAHIGQWLWVFMFLELDSMITWAFLALQFIHSQLREFLASTVKWAHPSNKSLHIHIIPIGSASLENSNSGGVGVFLLLYSLIFRLTVPGPWSSQTTSWFSCKSWLYNWNIEHMNEAFSLLNQRKKSYALYPCCTCHSTPQSEREQLWKMSREIK